MQGNDNLKLPQMSNFCDVEKYEHLNISNQTPMQGNANLNLPQMSNFCDDEKINI